MAKIGLPSITSLLPNDVRQFLQSVKEALTSMTTGTERAVTISDLVNGNIATVSLSGKITGSGSILDYSTPPTPTGLTASGALTTITLQWASLAYANLSYVEIWRANVDNQGLSVLVGQSVGLLYTDAVPAQSSYYYWIRFISLANIAGPFNALAGVHGTTSADPTTLISLLTDAGLYTNAPYYYQATPTTINGVSVPVGTYIKDVFIANGVISNAKIGNLAVDDAKISSMAVGKLIAGSISAGQYIQSTNYVSGSTGFSIQASGYAEFSNIVVRGSIYGNTNSVLSLGKSSVLDATAGVYLANNNFACGSGTTGISWDSKNFNLSSPQITINGETGSATFSGVLSAATGSFSGSLSAATGSFAGSLSGSDITGTTGSFTGSLSAATGTFSGSLTAAAVNAVNTINLAGQAVTIPVSASSYTAFASVAITSSGAMISIIAAASFSASSYGGGYAYFSLYRDGTLLKSVIAFGVIDNPGPYTQISSTGTGVIVISDTPGAGYHNYSMGGTGPTGVSNISSGITVLEVKR